MQFNEKKSDFPTIILSWHAKSNSRVLPWKAINDPYKIWLSEIMLQQTRANQVIPYYNKFIKRFPTVLQLAAAEDEEVFKLWEGLGYYSRCRNLLHTARYISFELKGVFPDTYSSLLKMKGIGNYTAAAIASFAYNIPAAVVDGNVVRVLSRLYGYRKPVDKKEGLVYIQKKAEALISKKYPAEYNQAIMDFGATVCLPKNPLCSDCVMQNICTAYDKNLTYEIPVKSKKTVKKHRYFNYLCFKNENRIWLQMRKSGDIWQNLHEFYLLESNGIMPEEAIKKSMTEMSVSDHKLSYNEDSYKQTLTHQLITARIHFVTVDESIEWAGGKWCNSAEADQLAFPRLLRTFMSENIIF